MATHFEVTTKNTDFSRIPASPGLTAKATEIAPRTLKKAVEAGFLPELNIDTVIDVARLPLLTSVRTAAGVPIPVLRMGVAETSGGNDPGHTVPRKYHGLGAHFSLVDFYNAANRWWKPSGRNRVLDAGYLVVAIGGITVGLLRVTEEPIESGGRLEYPGYLVARISDVLQGSLEFTIDATAEDRELASKVIATRSTTRGGGTIGVLDDDLDEE